MVPKSFADHKQQECGAGADSLDSVLGAGPPLSLEQPQTLKAQSMEEIGSITMVLAANTS